MRADLAEPRASVDWAIAQIPVLQERLKAWEGSDPYERFVEADTDPRYEVLAVRQRSSLDPLISPEIGAILNATRSALDLLAAALAARNGIKPSRKTHFPIYKTSAGFTDLRNGMDSDKVKEWLSTAEIATIKSLQPYGGGDPVLYPLNEMDVLRKHERLIVVYPSVERSYFNITGGGIEPCLRRTDDKTILYRMPAGRGFRLTKGNSYVASEIFFNEPALGIRDEPAFPLLRRYAIRVTDIIDMFDTP